MQCVGCRWQREVRVRRNARSGPPIFGRPRYRKDMIRMIFRRDVRGGWYRLGIVSSTDRQLGRVEGRIHHVVFLLGRLRNAKSLKLVWYCPLRTWRLLRSFKTWREVLKLCTAIDLCAGIDSESDGSREARRRRKA